MGDQENAGAAQSSENLLADPVWTYDPKANTEGSDAKSEDKEPQGTDGGEDAGKKSDGGDDKGEESKAEPKKEDKKEQTPPEKKEPPVRATKTKEDFIIERKQKQLEKARAEAQAKKEREDLWLEDEDEIDPEDDSTVVKSVKRNFGDRLDKIDQIEQELSLKAFEQSINEHFAGTDATKEEISTVKEYALHPAYSQVPFDTIMMAVRGKEYYIQLGAQQEKEAAKKAWASKVGGSVWSKSGDTKTDIASMTEQEFDDYQMKVRTGKI